MKEYCWQGQTDRSQPGFLSPGLVLRPGLSWAEWNATVFI
jgi:lysophospholipase